MTPQLKCKALLYRLFAFIVMHCDVSRLLAAWPGRGDRKKATADSYPLPQGRRYAKQGTGFQILNYHNIRATRDDFMIDTVAVAEFEAQMRFVCSRYSVYPLPYLVDELVQGNIDPRAIAITFDDGYQDLYYFALPILKKMKIPATVFLTTGLIGTTQQLWFDRVLSLLEHCRHGVIHAEIGDRLFSLPAESITDKMTSALEFLQVLKQVPPAVRDPLLDDLEKKYHTTGAAVSRRRLLTWEQIKTMRRHDVTFGAHTVHHNILTTLNRAEMENEIVGSRLAIENALQEPIDLFAYPNGKANDIDATAKAVLRENHFKAAVSTIRGFNTLSTDLFELRRGRPWLDDPDRFAVLLTWQHLKFAFA
jgi:peptidoglycan/xylan/chitin deacetylase (PgdA/CDA1 family)